MMRGRDVFHGHDCFMFPIQARIHTGFHRFMEISQIFHNKYIFFILKANFPDKISKNRLDFLRLFARLHPKRMELANIQPE